MPLLDLPTPSKTADKASVAAYTERNIARLTNALAGISRVFVDSSELDPTLRIGGGKHPLFEASRIAAAAGSLPIPVTGLHRDISHMKTALKVRSALADGLIGIRLDLTDISTTKLTSQALLKLLSENEIETSEALLVLDMQSVFGQDVDSLAAMINRLIAQIAHLKWEGVVVAGYGIPDELREVVTVRGQGYIQRTEQTIFRKVAKSNPIGKLWFGDYTTLSPSHVELDWRLISRLMSPKAIYTLDNDWFVVRGGPFSSHENGYEQYYDIAREIVALDEFSGAEFSYGDNYIKERSEDIPSPGSPQSWIKACVNHHITFTALSHND